MIFAIISDIHGCAPSLEKSLAIADSYEASHYCLLGDILYHGPRNRLTDGYNPQRVVEILNAKKEKIIAVRGNCDAEVDQMLLKFPITADYNEIINQDHKIFMTHGHLYDPTSLPLKNGDAFMSGHTHITKIEKTIDGITIFNPGSISLPKNNSFGTMGIFQNNKILLINIETTEIIDEFILLN